MTAATTPPNGYDFRSPHSDYSWSDELFYRVPSESRNYVAPVTLLENPHEWEDSYKQECALIQHPSGRLLVHIPPPCGTASNWSSGSLTVEALPAAWKFRLQQQLGLAVHRGTARHAMGNQFSGVFASSS